MRTVELAKVALAAEALRLRRMAQRQVLRVVYGCLGAVFAVAVLVLIHVTLYETAALWLSSLHSSLAVLVFDAVIGGVFAYLAAGSQVDIVEQEAGQIKQKAVAELRRSATVSALIVQTAGLFVRHRAKSSSPQPRLQNKLIYTPARSWFIR